MVSSKVRPDAEPYAGPAGTSAMSVAPPPTAVTDPAPTAEATPEPETPLPGARSRALVVLRWVLVGAYAAVLVWFIATYGVPLDRIGLTLWVLSGLAVFSVGRGWRSFGMMLVDWLPFTAVLIGYDYTRGLAGAYQGRYTQGALNDLGFPLHVTEPIAADKWMFGGQLPTLWLQHHLWTPGWAHWYDAAVTLVYITHFLATPVVAAVLWFVNRKRFRAFIGCVLAMALLGVATYIVYPMAPPWLAGKEGYTEHVARISGLGWSYLHLDAAVGVVQTGNALSNPVAAMPSLHTGYATMIALFFIVGTRMRWWGKVLLACYPFLMGFALVYSGEHYVIDVLFGMLYAAVIIGSWRLIRRWRAGRHARAADEPPGPATDDGVAAETVGATAADAH